LQKQPTRSKTANRESVRESIQRLRRCTQPCQDNDHVFGTSSVVICTLLQLRRCLRPCQINDHAAR
ncbi:hypothetical protein TRIATDRAFT_301279, partial [Trichoderma atroviride IMI 206040]